MRKSLIGLLAVLLAASACTNEQAGGVSPPPSGPIDVGVVTLKATSVPRYAELPGRVVATATADVRPQVDGIVRKVVFAEAARVAENDVLYELDDRKFQAAVAAATAEINRTAAASQAAQLAFDRAEKLAATNAVSTQTVDDARSTLLQAKAQEEAAAADLDTAKINLDDATVRAPIDGVIGVSTVSAGALVTANQSTALATIRQMDPIYVDLVDSSANLLRISNDVKSGRLSREPGSPPQVSLILEDGSQYGSIGMLKLAEMVVSQTSGTFSLRTSFPNPDNVLLPGMFVRARVDLGMMPGAFLIPQRAVQRSDSGEATLYVVSADGKAEQRTVTTMGSVGNDWIVVDGVQAGDRLIVDGFQKISDGSEVTPVEASINDDGVVPQTIPAPAAQNGGAEQ